ncbi:hypothetical protein HHK36_013039 [Tetracentron sinense]|uniref:Disease resistance R13L4/SHOC-2-like LRR domain-containing protein n=1 Tax=Tetracentron sinense TaxID=13715 RepID=A0A834Z980_TETSI|nr:hypothetical protein HHK36_013039 [Tetracentron sinense]
MFIFGVRSFSNSSMHTFFGGFRLLKVLDLKGAPLEMFPNEIANLFYLRYLSLRRTRIKRLPNSIGKLQNLVTLDQCTDVSELPSEILKLERLIDDCLESLQDLTNLVEIQLLWAYDGEVLCFKSGRFQRLKFLGLGKLEGLRLVRVEDGAMPHLQTLDIRLCDSHTQTARNGLSHSDCRPALPKLRF